jgi:hypothetical protein
MAWYDDIANTTKGNAQGLVNALMNPVDTAKAQFAKGAPYRQALASALKGDTAGINQALSKSELTPLDFGMMLGTVKDVRTNVGQMAFDPRFDKRVKEQDRLKNLSTTVERDVDKALPAMSIVDFEGYPFVTSMSDRLAAGGKLKEVNKKVLKHEVDLPGGQDYMLHNDDYVWASGDKPAGDILDQANMLYSETGRNPIHLPWRMAPSGGDFAHATGETMLSYAATSLGRSDKLKLDATMKQLIPDWKGVDSPISLAQYRALPDTKRKLVQNILDKNFRDIGGLSIGEARLAAADPTQLNSQVGGLMNVGLIHANKPLSTVSNNTSYPKAIHGQGLARLNEDINIYELLPDAAQARGIVDPKNPSRDDMRALQMKPYTGIVTENILKKLGF